MLNLLETEMVVSLEAVSDLHWKNVARNENQFLSVKYCLLATETVFQYDMFSFLKFFAGLIQELIFGLMRD